MARSVRNTGRKGRLRALLRVALLIILPLGAAAVALRVTPKDYVGSMDVAWSPSAVAQVDASSEHLMRFAPDQRVRSEAPPREMRAGRLLLAFAWQFAHKTRNAEGPIAYRVDELDGPDSVRISLHAPSREECLTRLNSFQAGFREEVEQQSSASRTRIAQRRDEVASQADELRALLATLPAGSTEGDGATPLTALADSCQRTREQWAAYARLRERVAVTRARRDALEQAPPVKNAVVDGASRETAYEAHTTLQEDMRHLEIQLYQMRVSLLAIHDEARVSLDELLTATEEISTLMTEAASASNSPSQRPLLEQASENAAEYHHQATLFAQDWTRDFLGLKGIALDPQTAEVLLMYDRLVQRVRDFRYLSDKAIGALRRRVSTISEQSEGSSATHVMDANIVRRFHDVQTAYRDFERTACELYAQDNYLLNAAVDSARGLWHRTGAARRDVDAELERRALLRAAEDRNQRIAALTAELDRLRAELLGHVDAIMAEADETYRIAGQLPALFNAATTGEALRQRRSHWAAKLEELTSQERRLADLSAELIDPAALQFSEAKLADMPDNMPYIAGAAGLAASLSLLALLGVLRVAGPGRH